MKIAEVESRFKDLSSSEFVGIVKKFGFSLSTSKEDDKKFFVHFDFKKTSKTKKKAPELQLKPCFYKKR